MLFDDTVNRDGEYHGICFFQDICIVQGKGIMPGQVMQRPAVGYEAILDPFTSPTHINDKCEVTWYEDRPGFAPD